MAFKNKTFSILLIGGAAILAVAIAFFQPGVQKQEKTEHLKTIWSDPQRIHDILSNNGMGGMRPWRKDGDLWIASTPYLDIGTKVGNNLMLSNISYYMTGSEENRVDYISVILNLNNREDYERASKLMENVTARIFDDLSFERPPISPYLIGLKDYELVTNDYRVVLDCDQESKVWSWVLRVYALEGTV